MNKLEKHIRTNRDKFDTFEPSADHMARFRTKLEPARVSLYSRIPYGLKIAAALVLVAISSVMVFEQAQKHYISRQLPLEETLPGDYSEARVYYTSLINEKYTEIDRLSESDPNRKEILFKELNEMDGLYHSMLKDLQTAPTDERILSAMINHYQIKLEIMGQIVQQLEQVNKLQSTYKNYEKSDV
jgi:hypothetical protein